MAETLTPRLGIRRWSADADTPSRAEFDADHATLDDLTAIDLQGTLAARPPAAIRGRYYYATDNGILYRDTGAAWATVGTQDLSAYARKDQAQTFTEDQTIAAAKALLVGASALGAETAAGGIYGGYNARWNGANYVRIAAVNAAALWNVQTNGDLVFYSNSDALNTVGSIVTLLERFRISKSGLVTGAGSKFAYKTAIETVISSTTPQDDNHLQLATGANEIWLVLFGLHVIASTSSADLLLTMVGPVGGGGSWSAAGPETSVTGEEGSGKWGIRSFGSTAPYAANGNRTMLFGWGLARNAGTAGNIGLKWAQVNNEATNVSLDTDSWIAGWRMV